MERVFLQNDMKAVTVYGRRYATYDSLPENLYLSLKNTASRFPKKIALVDERETITYSEFVTRVDQLANSLSVDYSLVRGDVCALLAMNSIDFCVAFYAITKVGAIALPLSTKLTSSELLHPLIDSGATILIADDCWYGKIEPIINQTKIKNVLLTGVGPDNLLWKRIRNLKSREVVNWDLPQLGDNAVLIYTSGTTGQPKGALITHLNLLHGIESYRRVIGLVDEDSTIISVPIFHITGLAALLGLFVYVGGTVFITSVFNARQTLDWIKQNKITFIHASPTVFLLLLEQQENFPELPSLKKAACGSANLPVPVIDRLRHWLPQMKMYVVYGLTESSSPATITPGDPIDLNKPGSSGTAIPGMEMRVVEPATDKELSSGNVGELELKGSNIITRYLSMDDAAQRAFHDGWFRTGDIAMIDPDGYVYILDRKKDMIDRGGEKIYSIEVENVINEHPAVLECAVVGVPDPVYGEVVKAFIHIRENMQITQTELAEFIGQKLAKFKRPTIYEFVTELPRTATGKINKKALRIT